jgi:hypothetical protein
LAASIRNILFINDLQLPLIDITVAREERIAIGVAACCRCFNAPQLSSRGASSGATLRGCAGAQRFDCAVASQSQRRAIRDDLRIEHGENASLHLSVAALMRKAR